MKQAFEFRIDLSEIDGDGDFSCPNCGITISPDDETEESYSIIEAKMGQHNLGELIIRCSKCESTIHMTGFSLLQKLETRKKTKKSKRSMLLCL